MRAAGTPGSSPSNLVSFFGPAPFSKGPGPPRTVQRPRSGVDERAAADLQVDVNSAVPFFKLGLGLVTI